jgi:hypothetical protein
MGHDKDQVGVVSMPAFGSSAQASSEPRPDFSAFSRMIVTAPAPSSSPAAVSIDNYRRVNPKDSQA